MHLFRQHAIKDHAAAAALVPVIDYGPYFGGVPGALQRLADELRHACETVGFFYALNQACRRPSSIEASLRRINFTRCSWVTNSSYG